MRTDLPKLTDQYPYVRLWCRYLGSYEYYAVLQVDKAKQLNAPKDAVFEKSGPAGEDTGIWVTLPEIRSERFKEYVQEWRDHGGKTIGDR